MRATRRRARQGFTLLEVMVTLIIFSLITLGSFHVLTSLLHTKAALQQQNERLEQLQNLLMTVHHDVSQLVPRVTSFPLDPQNPQSMINPKNPYLQLNTAGPFTFIALGWRNPLGEARSTLAYTQYRLDKGGLLRELWPYADYTDDHPAVSRPFPDTVDRVRFHAIASIPDTATASSVATNPMAINATAASGAAPLLPVAVDVSVTMQPYGDVHELIPLVQTP